MRHPLPCRFKHISNLPSAPVAATPTAVPRRPSMFASFDDEQRELSQLWKKARKNGCMSPCQQAKGHGLKEAWEELRGDRVYGKTTWIADRVYVRGPGRHRPDASSISKLIGKMDEDEDWFQGKVHGSLGGRPPALSDANKAAIASSAMAMKQRGVEPTYGLIIAQCPNASINPATGGKGSRQASRVRHHGVSLLRHRS